MDHPVAMPQLGMTQDSGVIVKWRKKVGDEVAAADILMEVETDKAVMEVEAGRAGTLTEILAAEGQEVAVGAAVAVIAGTGSPAPAAADPAAAADAARPAPAADSGQSVASAEAAPPARPAAQAAGAKILASPKAKAEAARRGIDLRALVRRGVPQPFHAADLDAAATGAPSALQARVGSAGLEALRRTPQAAELGAGFGEALWCALAAAAWRQALGLEEQDRVAVEYLSAGAATGACRSDPDLAGLAAPARPAAAGSADLRVRDLGASPFSLYLPRAAGTVPQIAVSMEGAQASLTLIFDESTCPLQQASALLADLAQRAAEPLRQIM